MGQLLSNNSDKQINNNEYEGRSKEDSVESGADQEKGNGWKRVGAWRRTDQGKGNGWNMEGTWSGTDQEKGNGWTREGTWRGTDWGKGNGWNMEGTWSGTDQEKGNGWTREEARNRTDQEKENGWKRKETYVEPIREKTRSGGVVYKNRIGGGVKGKISQNVTLNKFPNSFSILHDNEVGKDVDNGIQQKFTAKPTGSDYENNTTIDITHKNKVHGNVYNGISGGTESPGDVLEHVNIVNDNDIDGYVDGNIEQPTIVLRQQQTSAVDQHHTNKTLLPFQQDDVDLK